MAYSVIKFNNALPAPMKDEIITLEEHIQGSEVSRKTSVLTYDYMLNDKASKSKILKAAKRVPLEM